jgi:hypothetical protein
VTTAAPTAIEMSRTIIDQISTAVASGGDAASARAALADVLKNQGGAMAAATASPAAPAAGAMSVGAKVILRPNGEEYHVRKVATHDDVQMLRSLRKAGINVMAYGPPGTGKTALIEAAFAGDDLPEAERGMYTVQGSGDTEVADFVGGFIQLPNGQYEWVDGPMLRAMEEGKPLYVDEVPLIDPKVLAGLYSVMDGRNELRVTQNPERGVVKAKPGFYVLAACNPNAPGARMSEALTSRFNLQFEVTTDYQLAKKLGVSSKMVTAAQNMQRKLEKGEMGWAPQLRELLAFKDVSALLGEDVALRNVISGSPEIDRPMVQDVLSRSFAKQLTELRVE